MPTLKHIFFFVRTFTFQLVFQSGYQTYPTLLNTSPKQLDRVMIWFPMPSCHLLGCAAHLQFSSAERAKVVKQKISKIFTIRSKYGVMDEQRFHGLEGYSFFHPLHCLDRRNCLITWRVKEEYQAMFSFLQLSSQRNWAESQTELFVYLAFFKVFI